MSVPDEAVEAAFEAFYSKCDVDFDAAHAIVAALEAATPFIAAQATAREWGITYADEQGDLHAEWGYTRNPFEQIDKDGEFQTGKRTWGKACEIVSRPMNAQTSEWQSDDCPWKAP